MTGSGTFEVMDETGTEDIWYDTMGHGRLFSGSLFALHEACIETSCKASRLDELGEKPSLAVLYQLLSARFLRRHFHRNLGDDTVNDLFDLCRTSSLYGPRSVLALTKLEWWNGQHDVRIFLVASDCY
jgi:hypothetical protein